MSNARPISLSQDDVLLLDEGSDGLVVEYVLGQPPPSVGGAQAHVGQVVVETVPPVDLEVLGQVV